MNTRNIPRTGVVYTLKEIAETLSLRDSAFLTVSFSDPFVSGTVQDSDNMSPELDFDKVPGLAETKWKYLYETDEWCPIFRYQGTHEEFTKLFDCVPEIDCFTGEPDPDKHWITVKGFPREQYVSK